MRIWIAAIGLIVLVSSFPITAIAAPPNEEDMRSLNLETMYSVSAVAQCNSSTGVQIDPDTNLDETVIKAFQFLIGEKPEMPDYSAEQAAGIIGNLIHESGGAPNRLIVDSQEQNPVNGGRGGYGIAQWTGARRTALMRFTSNYKSLDEQLKYLWHELQTSEKTSDKELRLQPSVAASTKSFMDEFERPDKRFTHYDRRLKYAENVFAKLKNTPGATSSGSTGCDPTTSGSPECGTATGNAKILCEAKKYEGIYYQFGAGHGSYSAFRAKCPLDKISEFAKTSTPENPGPCALDCSSLVSVAVAAAFNNNKSWTTGGIASDTANWQKISFSQLKPGDVVYRPPSSGSAHVEVVDHYQDGKLFLFGAHRTGKTISGITDNTKNYTAAYRYVGIGSEGKL